MFLFPVLAVSVLLGCGKASPTDSGEAKPTIQLAPADLSGQGATFVEPIMKFWTEEFRTRTAEKVKINVHTRRTPLGLEAGSALRGWLKQRKPSR